MNNRKLKFAAALALTVAGAAIFFAARESGEPPRGRAVVVPPGFVTTRGAQFELDGHAFRFVGANVAVIHGDEPAHAPETLRAAARAGVKVVRVWAFGELGEDGKTAPGGATATAWLRANPFRRGPDGWNEAAFANLDRVLDEAARNELRVQICLTNWWADTGGVAQYLAWAGVRDAYDESQPHHINAERAALFYTNATARTLYRRHVERIVSRRNTINGKLYRDDPTIFGYELMNEAQSPTGRWAERRAWVAEMSAYVKSLDPNHLVTPGTWGYRASWERREWLADHALPDVDYCDVHVYPRDDADSYVETPTALAEFIDNRAAAAFSINKPLVVGEFGLPPGGFKGFSQPVWFKSFYESATRAGLGGTFLWIWTHESERDYAVTHTTARDEKTREVIQRAAQNLTSQKDFRPPRELLDAGRHLVPRQFAFAREEARLAPPELKYLEGEILLYRFTPEHVAAGRFEKLGGGAGYVWGAGVGFFEYVVPARADRRRVGEIVVRAHLQPTLPPDSHGRLSATRVTLYVNGKGIDSRLVSAATPPQAVIQEWRINSLSVRAQAARGLPLRVRFAVEADADQPYGVNISNFPEGFDARGASPIEVEIR